MKISSTEIRTQLRRFDSPYPWGMKISKTNQLYDTDYLLLSVIEAQETVLWVNKKVAESFNVRPDQVPTLWRELGHDCDNFAGEMVTFANIMFALKPGATLQPAIFRVIASLKTGVHAYNIIFTDQGIFFADLLMGTGIWALNDDQPKIIGFG